MRVSYVVNAFPAAFLANAMIAGKRISQEEACQLVLQDRPKSAVGHKSTADLFTSLLGTPVEENRCTLQYNDLFYGGSGRSTCLLGAYQGPRLAEGTTDLPEGATITWILLGEIEVHIGQDYAQGRMAMLADPSVSSEQWSDVY